MDVVRKVTVISFSANAVKKIPAGHGLGAHVHTEPRIRRESGDKRVKTGEKRRN